VEILHSYISKYRVWTVTINYDIGLGSEKFVLQFLINCVRLMEGVEMKNIFVNLKRFDVPKSYGGICPVDNPSEWIQWIIDDCVKNKLGMLKGMRLTFLVPESLIIPAIERLSYYSKDDVSTINIGSQGVYRENVEKGVNFGAFTTNLPAAAAKNSGCKWTIIGHSEERKDKLGIISSYDPEVI
jgi:triosephosphate isomerase